jgi:hypothetical protein
MSGTPLNPARFAGLMATVAKSFPLELLTDKVCKSWEDNGEELARRLAFLSESAPAPKRKGKEKAQRRVDLSDFFVSSDRLYVDPDFLASIDVTSCVEDLRELSVKFVLPRSMNDSENAKAVGGMGALTAMRSSPYQLKCELALALEGKSKLFIKSNWYLLYMESRDGTLFAVDVRWSGDQLGLSYYRFDERDYWLKGDQVCGN